MEDQQLIAVPAQWLESLLEYATQFQEIEKAWEYGKSMTNDKIHFKAVTLAGYAKSSSYILKNNEKVETKKNKTLK